jgi:hypothetical protein
LVRRPLTGLLYQHRMMDDECGPIGGMRIGRGSRSTRRKPAPVPLCPPQSPHDLCWNPGRRGGKPATKLWHCLCNLHSHDRENHRSLNHGFRILDSSCVDIGFMSLVDLPAARSASGCVELFRCRSFGNRFLLSAKCGLFRIALIFVYGLFSDTISSSASRPTLGPT